MAIIEPVSTLSIKRAVNLYTIILFLSFGVLLYWLAADRYEAFVKAHEDKAGNTTKIVAFEINKTIKEKRRIIDIFVDSYSESIIELSDNPEDEGLYIYLADKLRQYYPDFTSFNIIDSSGEPIINDFEGNIGELCMDDVRRFIKSGKQDVRLHPNHNVYHYDVFTRFAFGDDRMVFFVSFNISEFADILSSVQSESHSLILINKEVENLIEVTSTGGRESLSGRLDFRMKGDEMFRVLSSSKVKDTRWHVVDMRDEDLFSDFRNDIIKEYIVAYYVLVIIILFMRNILINQDEKRTTAERQLQANHEQIKVLNAQLELLSITDGLTGLYNRRHFNQVISKEWNRGLRSHNPLTCVLIDVDYFKDYNDAYGHQAGDQCLIDVANVLKDTFRRGGDFVARYGGEEFVILMGDCSKEDAIAAVELLQIELAKLRIPHSGSQVNDYVTISAGIVNEAPTRNQTIDSYIRKADDALYQAKAEGRNKWVMAD